MKNEKHYLLTYYIKNTDEQTKHAFSIIPYKSLEIDLSEYRLWPLIDANLMKNPFLCSCTVMAKDWYNAHEYKLKYTIDSPYYREEPIPREHKPVEARNLKIDDYMNQAYMTTYEPSYQGCEVRLDHEGKVIRLGSYFYDLKGVLICEATDKDKQKYHCDRYVTFPIVDNNWRVYDGDEIADGIERLIVGKKGDTIPLVALTDAIDYNARHHDCEFEFQLVDLELHGITISNRKHKNSAEELQENVIIGIDKIGKNHFRMDADWGGYYIARRFFYVGDDDELYESDDDEFKPSAYRNKLVTSIVDDVSGLSWFFNKPNLRVLVTAITQNGFGFKRNELGPIPKDWFYTVQTLEGEINLALDEYHQEYPNDYNRNKRPDIVEKK